MVDSGEGNGGWSVLFDPLPKDGLEASESIGANRSGSRWKWEVRAGGTWPTVTGGIFEFGFPDAHLADVGCLFC